MAAVLATLLILVAAAMTWQHVRYLHARRDIVQDRQPMVYGAATFHVVTFLATEEGSDVIKEVRKLRDVLESAPDAQLIYAGQASFTLASSQLGARSWDAVVLVQYPSREAYAAAAGSDAHRQALGAFADSYAHGMQRACVPNLLIPQALLGLRVVDILKGNWHAPALEAAPEPDQPELLAQLRARQEELLRMRPVNDSALVVFNLILPGTAEEQAADRSYGLKMMRRMAALTHGPMHMGAAVTLDGDARFEQVVIVYYPGASYFAELVGSRFFQGIIGDKKLGDTQAVPTVPILSLL